MATQSCPEGSSALAAQAWQFNCRFGNVTGYSRLFTAARPPQTIHINSLERSLGFWRTPCHRRALLFPARSLGHIKRCWAFIYNPLPLHLRQTLALLSPPSLFPFNSHLALRLALKPRAASFTPPFYILDIDTGCKSRLTGRDLWDGPVGADDDGCWCDVRIEVDVGRWGARGKKSSLRVL